MGSKNIREYSEKKWSIYTWYVIHTVCLYASKNDKVFGSRLKKYKTFFSRLQRGLPCSECVAHCGDYLLSHPFKLDTNMHEWAVAFHNTVNRRLSKSQYNSREAKSFYTNSSGDLQIDWLYYYFMVRIYANVAYTNRTLDALCLLLDSMRSVIPDLEVKKNLPKSKQFKDKNTFIKNYLKVLRNLSEKSVQTISKFGET